MRIIVPSAYPKPASEKDIAPAALEGHVLEGAVVRYLESSWGYALSQCVTGDWYVLWVHLVCADQPVTLHFHNTNNCIFLMTVPEASGMTAENEPGEESLFPPAGKARLVYAPGNREYKASFRKNSQSLICYINLSFQFVEGAFDNFKERRDNPLLLLQAAVSTPRVIARLGDVRLSTEHRKMLFSLKKELGRPGGMDLWLVPGIRMILWWYLSSLDDKPVEASARDADFRVSIKEIKAVILVAELIITDIRINHPVSFLADKADGMTVKRLRRVFQHHFKRTIHSFRHEKVMEEGLFLLTVKNMSVKSVAIQLGYKSSADFGKAFKSFYGVPPTDMKAGK